MRAVVVGFGSTLRSDDGIGPHVAQRVAQVVDSTDVLVITRQTLTPDLVCDIENADRVVFIDASAAEAPGVIREQWLESSSDTSADVVHSLEPSGLLELCRRAFGRAPEAVLITVGGNTFEIGDTLSPEVRSSIPLLVGRTIELVR